MGGKPRLEKQDVQFSEVMSHLEKQSKKKRGWNEK